MKSILYICCCLCFLTFTEVQEHTFEEWVEKWIEDGANAFEKVEKKYLASETQPCGKVTKNHGFNDNGIGHFYAELKIASSKDYSRRELHQQFHELKVKIEAMSYFEKWKHSESIQRFFGNVQYKQENETQEFTCELALEEWSGEDILVLKLNYKGPSKKEGKVNPFNDSVRKIEASDTTILAASELKFSQDIRHLISEPAGEKAFEQLLAAADNDFQEIISTPTNAPNQYFVKDNSLNPKAKEPHQFILDKGQMRTELHLRFMELYGTLGWRMDSDIKATLRKILSEEWNIQEKQNGSWSATLKNGKQHKRIVRREKNNRDYLVIEVIRKPFRKYVEQYPQLLKGNCVEGNCTEGKGKFIFQEDRYYDLSYEGNFQNGYFDGIGYTYLEYLSNDDIPSFDLGHYSKDKKQLLFMGQYKQGKRHGKGISYAYTKYKDKHFSRREKSEYFQKEEQTEVFSYIFQDYKEDSLQSEELCYFSYYNTFSNRLTIDYPFTTEHGQCISGDCESGRGVLSMKTLGKYDGYFRNGKATGSGILKMKTGEWKVFKTYKGIPQYVRTIKLPKGISRLAAAKRKVWQLAENDCLEGNCYDGEGLRLRLTADRFRYDNVRYRGYLKGSFDEGKIDGKFQILSLSDYKCTIDAYAENSKLEGEFIIQYADEEEPRYEYYKKGNRVTKDGQDYEEYLDEEVRRIEEKYERKRQAEIATAKARKERREAEARRQRAASQKTSRSSQYRSGFCHSCRGTGSYWHETITQDCTKTYDYTYSSGKYHQTTMDCRDVKSGNYVRCSYCGGDGRF